MIDADLVKLVQERLSSGDRKAQAEAALHIRDLCEDVPECRTAFSNVVPPLVGLLDTSAAPDSQELTHTAAQALGYLAEADAIRDQIREVGGIENIVSVLKALAKASVSTPLGRDLRTTLLTVLLAVAVDEDNRVAAYKAGLVPLLVHMLGLKDDPVAVERAAKLLGRLAYNRTIKDSVRDASGIGSLLKLLSVERGAKLDARMAETVVVALTVLAVNNELNQDTIRDEYGVAPIVKLLEGHQGPPVTSAALDAVRAMSLNNDANKNALREAWVLPQLVKLLAQADDNILGKAVDCLRILTTGNEANKAALFSIPSSLSALVRLMDNDKPLVIVERSAAVVGNLSGREQYFPAMREAGAMQRLVELLERGPQSRVTEIAAKTLANLAVDESNQTAIRLAGGIPPLMRLLTVRPTDQVLGAVEEALRRLQVSGAERNAILDTLRYVDVLLERHERTARDATSAAARSHAEATAHAAAQGGSAADTRESKPFTQYTVEETVELLRSVGFRETACIEANGITGDDLLELTEHELRKELGLSHLQAKKIRGLQAAFKTFNSVMRRPGRGEITFLELQEWLLQHGRSQQDVASLREGYMQALGKSTLAVLTFHEFVKTWGWLNSTLGLMAAGDDGDNSEPPAKERPPDSNGEAAAA